MTAPDTDTSRAWVTTWLDGVADGSNTMSQRSLSSIKKHAGSLDVAVAAARQRGVHLLLLEDDKGTQIVAASAKPFGVLC